MNNEITIRGYLDILRLKDEYLNYIDVADTSVKTYNVGIKAFANYMKDNGITTPAREDIINFRDSYKGTHSIDTINSYLISVRTFFKFLAYKGIYKNIADNIKNLPETDLHKRDALTIEQCVKVLDHAENLREKALFSITLGCGLRANEVVNIELKDFKESGGKILLYILGKGRSYKQDFVIVPDNIMGILKEYIKEYNITDYLFTSLSHNNTGGKVHTYTVRTIINNMFERVGIKTDKMVFHSLRHTFATIAIQNGNDIREVANALRHKKLSTTERYLHDLDARNNSCSSSVASIVFK